MKTCHPAQLVVGVLFTALTVATAGRSNAQSLPATHVPTSGIVAPLVQPSTQPAAAAATPDPEVEKLRGKLELETQRVELLRTNMESYKDQVNTGLAIIGILLGLVGVLLPILTYVTSILPGNKVVAEARRVLSGLDRRFVELSEKEHTRQVDEAIQRLAADDPMLRQAALTYLSLNAHYAFTEKQLFELCEAVRTAADVNVNSPLLNVLANHDSPHVRRLLRDEVQKSGDSPFAIMYLVQNCARTNSPEARAWLTNWILSTPEGQGQLPNVLTWAVGQSLSFFQTLLDDTQIAGGVGVRSRVLALTYARGLAKMYPGAQEIIATSALASSLSGRRTAFVAGDYVTDVADPKDAEALLVFVDGEAKGTFRGDTAEFKAAASEYVAKSSG